MKYLITGLVSAMLSFGVMAAETKKVCTTVNGKEQCKQMKVHKKVEDAKEVPKDQKKK